MSFSRHLVSTLELAKNRSPWPDKNHQSDLPFLRRSHPKLPQMMVKMFVH